jgi:hypothetical protein
MKNRIIMSLMQLENESLLTFKSAESEPAVSLCFVLTFRSFIIVIFVNIEARVDFNAQVFGIFGSNRCQVALFNDVDIPSPTSIGKSILFTVRRLEEIMKETEVRKMKVRQT